MTGSDVKTMIEELVAAVGTPKYAYNCKQFNPEKDTVFYSGPYWDEKEVIAGVTAFLTGKWLVSGEQVAKFQWAFGHKFNVKHCHMVNSGSSANLTMVAALKKHLGWKDGDQVIVSPVGFPTTIAPLVQNGLVPVFVDIEMKTLNFDLDHVEKWITDKTVAIFVSPVLGNPPDMDRIKAMCEKHGIRLIGDNCDSLGTKWDGKLLTDYYYAWTTSFYPAHHISTGEGGMVCSNDEQLINTPADAVMIVPLIKEYLDVQVKNNDHLVRMASVVQRAMTNSASAGSSDLLISEEEKEQLLLEVKKMGDETKQLEHIDTNATVIVTPAEGPSLGVAAAGK